MVITRKDVKRNILTALDGEQVQDEAQRPVERRVGRTRAKPQEDVVDLNKLNTNEFEALLGEGSAPAVITESKELVKHRKNMNHLQLQTLLKVNQKIVATDSVTTPVTAEVPENDEEASVGDVDKNVNVRDVDDDNVPIISGSEDVLDTTVKLLVDTGSQTDPCMILCRCTKCKDCVQSFLTLVHDGHSIICDGSTNSTNNVTESSLQRKESGQVVRPQSPWSTSVNSEKDDTEMMPLYKGSSVKISVTAKALLRGLDRSATATAKEYIYCILDALYPSKELANMTASGRTKGSIGVSDHVKQALLVYIQNKFNSTAGMAEINAIINQKCYLERRKLWVSGDPSVREKYKKKEKDKNVPAKKVDRQSELINDSNGPKTQRAKKRCTVTEVVNFKRKRSSKEAEKLAEIKKGKIMNSHRIMSSPKMFGKSSSRSRKSTSEKHRVKTGGKRPKSFEEIQAYRSAADLNASMTDVSDGEHPKTTSDNAKKMGKSRSVAAAVKMSQKEQKTADIVKKQKLYLTSTPKTRHELSKAESDKETDDEDEDAEDDEDNSDDVDDNMQDSDIIYDSD